MSSSSRKSPLPLVGGVVALILVVSTIYYFFFYKQSSPPSPTPTPIPTPVPIPTPCVASTGCPNGKLCRSGACIDSQTTQVIVAEGDSAVLDCEIGEKYEIVGPVILRPLMGKPCPDTKVPGMIDITAGFPSLQKNVGNLNSLNFTSGIPTGTADPCPYHRKEVVLSYRCVRR